MPSVKEIGEDAELTSQEEDEKKDPPKSPAKTASEATPACVAEVEKMSQDKKSDLEKTEVSKPMTLDVSEDSDSAVKPESSEVPELSIEASEPVMSPQSATSFPTVASRESISSSLSAILPESSASLPSSLFSESTVSTSLSALSESKSSSSPAEVSGMSNPCSAALPESTTSTPSTESDSSTASQIATMPESTEASEALPSESQPFEFESHRIQKEKKKQQMAQKVKEYRESSVFKGQVKRRLEISAPDRTTKNIYPKLVRTGSRFRILFDVSLFKNESLSINILGNKIDVYGSQVHMNEFGEEFHEIHQIFEIPDYVDDTNFSACITKEEFLLLDAPLK